MHSWNGNHLLGSFAGVQIEEMNEEKKEMKKKQVNDLVIHKQQVQHVLENSYCFLVNEKVVVYEQQLEKE